MDLRIERTYRLLTQAFTELLEEVRYDNITVASLCDRAMIRRTTFYKHFADKDEFFVFYLKSLRDEFEQRIKDSKETSYREHEKFMLKETLLFLKKHERLTNNVINSSNSMLLFDVLTEVIFNDSLHILKEKQTANNAIRENIDLEIESAFFSGGIIQMMRYWWKKGCPAGGETYMLSAIEKLP